MNSFDLTNIAKLKLIYLSRVKAADRLKVTCSRNAFDLLISVWDRETIEYFEEFKVRLMNRSNSVLGIIQVSKVGVSGTVTDVRIVMQAAIKSNSSGIIIAHNYPSGNLNPSESDSKITQKIKGTGNLLDIQLLDHHLITGDGDYNSFEDNGLI